MNPIVDVSDRRPCGMRKNMERRLSQCDVYPGRLDLGPDPTRHSRLYAQLRSADDLQIRDSLQVVSISHGQRGIWGATWTRGWASVRTITVSSGSV